jgi:hypothetical protein
MLIRVSRAINQASVMLSGLFFRHIVTRKLFALSCNQYSPELGK